jgi:hypothetical protein
VTDPNGVKGTTVVNGINDAGDLVGFYTQPNTGYTIGMLATATAAAGSSVAETGATASRRTPGRTAVSTMKTAGADTRA